MSVVKNTINEIVLLLKNKKIFKIKPIKQDLKKEIRHTKKKDFFLEDVDIIIKKKIKKNLFSHKNFSNL